ncbi:MAG: RidA family protein [Solirubrobacteraceae bacterium]
MSRRELRISGLPEPISHYTDVVLAGDLLFVSGVVPVDESGALVGGDDVVAQAEQVFGLIGRVLAGAGGAPADR